VKLELRAITNNDLNREVLPMTFVDLGIQQVKNIQEGDSRSVGQGVLEMRIDYGPGYRIYYVHRGAHIVILLCGGAISARSSRASKSALRLAETL
jgi:putative addiction module killer protein